jgi:hypothetical protein
VGPLKLTFYLSPSSKFSSLLSHSAAIYYVSMYTIKDDNTFTVLYLCKLSLFRYHFTVCVCVCDRERERESERESERERKRERVRMSLFDPGS